MSNLKSWHDAAKTDQADYYIHPSGADAKDYELSGKAEAKRVSALFPKGTKTVLEYGCGNGRVLKHLKRKYDVCGVDIVPEFVRECNNINIDAYTLPDMPNGEFDVVYSITVFIHMSKTEGKHALQNIHKMLKAGGLALLEIPVYDVPKDPNGWIDVGVWSVSQLEDTAKEIGFEIIDLKWNEGAFSYAAPGPNHNAYQILKKCQ